MALRAAIIATILITTIAITGTTIILLLFLLHLLLLPYPNWLAWGVVPHICPNITGTRMEDLHTVSYHIPTGSHNKDYSILGSILGSPI